MKVGSLIVKKHSIHTEVNVFFSREKSERRVIQRACAKREAVRVRWNGESQFV